jgi:hypothetical protein
LIVGTHEVTEFFEREAKSLSFFFQLERSKFTKMETEKRKMRIYRDSTTDGIFEKKEK